MTMEKRRQNVSCEQCRRSKKACDGFSINMSQKGSPDATMSAGKNHRKAVLPCSYCSRTSKACSLHPQWDRAQLGDVPARSCMSEESPRKPHISRKRKRVYHNKAIPPGLSEFLALPSPESIPMMPFVPTPSQHYDPLAVDETLTVPLHTGTAYHTDFTNTSTAVDDSGLPSTTSWTTFSPFDSVNEQQLQGGDNLSYSFDTPSVDSGSIQQAPNAQDTLLGYPQMDTGPSLSMTPFAFRYRDSKQPDEEGQSLDEFSNTNSILPENSLSPFGLTSSVAMASNRTLISQSLLRIYHDVLENNLCCWIAEDTCPYKVDNRPSQLTQLPRLPNTRAESPLEWGAVWSNRMYRRVKKLDLVARSTGLIRMTRSENQAASKALDLTIMAFAAQWSQGNRRKEQFEASVFGGEEDDDEQFGDDHFEQVLQQSVWEQAKRALKKVAELECFRVVYAELVFGLIQKPWSCYDHPDPDEINDGDGHQFGSIRSWILPQLLEILSEGGPPIALERAARKIHALKSRLESKELRDGNDSVASFSTEDRRTIGLLQWLGVMFDTVSSAMNERPTVVSDEDCRHDQAPEMVSYRRWELDLYAQENSKQPSPLHWPCSLESATLALSRSAAVKVLLWRYVSYIQSALRKRESPEAIEETIDATLAVYQYWNKTHGAFFRDLTDNFDAVPARLKSWYPCIAIPWNLATLTLADLIEFVDDHRLGLENARGQRIDGGLVLRIRRASATELAELASVTAPQEPKHTMIEQLPEFHFAVSQSSLLTEPWTVLLIRAFAKAALFHLSEAEGLLRHGWHGMEDAHDDFKRSVSLGSTCTRTLWFLGSKSEMARGVARVLAKSLSRFDTNHVPTFSPLLDQASQHQVYT